MPTVTYNNPDGSKTVVQQNAQGQEISRSGPTLPSNTTSSTGGGGGSSAPAPSISAPQTDLQKSQAYWAGKQPGESPEEYYYRTTKNDAEAQRLNEQAKTLQERGGYWDESQARRNATIRTAENQQMAQGAPPSNNSNPYLSAAQRAINQQQPKINENNAYLAGARLRQSAYNANAIINAPGENKNSTNIGGLYNNIKNNNPTNTYTTNLGPSMQSNSTSGFKNVTLPGSVAVQPGEMEYTITDGPLKGISGPKDYVDALLANPAYAVYSFVDSKGSLHTGTKAEMEALQASQPEQITMTYNDGSTFTGTQAEIDLHNKNLAAYRKEQAYKQYQGRSFLGKFGEQVGVITSDESWGYLTSTLFGPKGIVPVANPLARSLGLKEMTRSGNDIMIEKISRYQIETPAIFQQGKEFLTSVGGAPVLGKLVGGTEKIISGSTGLFSGAKAGLFTGSRAAAGEAYVRTYNNVRSGLITLGALGFGGAALYGSSQAYEKGDVENAVPFALIGAAGVAGGLRGITGIFRRGMGEGFAEAAPTERINPSGTGGAKETVRPANRGATVSERIAGAKDITPPEMRPNMRNNGTPKTGPEVVNLRKNPFTGKYETPTDTLRNILSGGRSAGNSGRIVRENPVNNAPKPETKKPTPQPQPETVSQAVNKPLFRQPAVTEGRIVRPAQNVSSRPNIRGNGQTAPATDPLTEMRQQSVGQRMNEIGKPKKSYNEINRDNYNRKVQESRNKMAERRANMQRANPFRGNLAVNQMTMYKGGKPTIKRGPAEIAKGNTGIAVRKINIVERPPPPVNKNPIDVLKDGSLERIRDTSIVERQKPPIKDKFISDEMFGKKTKIGGGFIPGFGASTGTLGIGQGGGRRGYSKTTTQDYNLVRIRKIMRML